MQQTRDYLETLRRIASGMGPQRAFQAGLKALLSLLAERHLFLRPHLVIFDPETRTLRLCMADSNPRSGQVVYAPGVGVTGQVFATGAPVIVERLLGHPVFLSKFFERTVEEMGNLAFLSVPVLTPEPEASVGVGVVRQVIGVLSMDTPCAPREELELRTHFLEVVASLIATQAAYFQEDLNRQQRLGPAGSGSGITMNAPGDENMVAVSKSMRIVLEQAAYAGHNRGPVLIIGESGTGKERLAGVIHSASPRAEMPLVRFHGTGLPDELAERELFGYRKGAFPGAMQTRKGLFELAQSSTLFLEDVDTLSMAVQKSILRALQNQEVTRVGGGQAVSIDVRLICSATQPLERLVDEGRFLEELCGRIAAFPILMAPLRERHEDILPLARFFMQGAAVKAGKIVERISVPAQDMLERYTWPGNIHELRHCMEQAVLTCDDKVLRTGHLPLVLQASHEANQVSELSFNDAVAHFERELLTDALQRSQGNMLQAARDLQASYRIVNYKVKKYGIDPRKFGIIKS